MERGKVGPPHPRAHHQTASCPAVGPTGEEWHVCATCTPAHEPRGDPGAVLCGGQCGGWQLVPRALACLAASCVQDQPGPAGVWVTLSAGDLGARRVRVRPGRWR